MKKKTQIIENNKVIIENKAFDIEELRRKYEEENWTVEQLSNFLSLSQSQTVRFLKECGIHKKQDFSQKITISCGKPTPLGVGWIALYFKNNSK